MKSYIDRHEVLELLNQAIEKSAPDTRTQQQSETPVAHRERNTLPTVCTRNFDDDEPLDSECGHLFERARR